MGDFSLVIYNGSGGTLTFDRSTNTTRLKSRLLSQDVNYSAILTFTLENHRTAAADNLLSSSFAGWSSNNPAALAVGMGIDYDVTPTDFSTGLPGSSAEYFHGFITSISQEENGDLTIVARDYLYPYENLYFPKVSYTSYRDYYSRDVGVISSGTYAYKLAIESVDSDGYYPGVDVSFLTDDFFFDYDTDIDSGGAGGADLTAGNAFAQAFIAEDVEVLGVLFQGDYTEDPSATEHSVLRVSIRDDDGADRPSTSSLFYVDIELTATGAQWIWTYFDTTNETFERLLPGRKYWIHVEHYTTDATYPGYWQHYVNASGTYVCDQTDAHYVYGSVPLDSGSNESAGNLVAFAYLAKRVTIAPENYVYYLDGATPKLVLLSLPTTYPGLPNPPTVLPETLAPTDRGRVSYYYSTRQLRYVFEDIINLEFDNNAAPDVNSNIDLGLAVYKTSGKPLGTCLRELADLYGYNNSGTYNQCAILAGHDTFEINVARRKNITDDASVVSFMYGADTATDSYRRILSASFTKSSEHIPGVVRVVGQSTDGRPIICERDGRGVGVGNYTDTVNHRLTKIVTDPSLTTLDAVNRRAWTELDRYSRTSWDGEIVVSGVYPQLISRSSGTYGSGEIITITHSLFGLSAVKFAVTGIDVGTNSTKIRVTNANVRRDNLVRDSVESARRAEAFTSGQDDQTYRYVYVYRVDVTADTTLYAQLCSADGTIIGSHSNYTAHRVPCTRLTQPSGGTDYGTVVYRAEFAPENGYGTVERIELYSDLTGGTEEAEFDFSAHADSAHEFYKAKTMTVVVEYGV